jgi:hypothetical protein
MTVTVHDLHALAKHLSQQGDEASLRSAVSRGYYAAYHACGAWEKHLPAQGFDQGPQGGVHQQLCNRLRNPAPAASAVANKSRILGGQLDVLRVKRIAADYHLASSTISAADASSACALAEVLLNKAGTYP